MVHKGALTVDFDDRQPFAISRLQLGIAADVDLLEVEGNLAADVVDDRPGTFAEVTALRVVQRDALYG